MLSFISHNLLKSSNSERIPKPLACSYFNSNFDSDPVAETKGTLVKILSPEVRLKHCLLQLGNASCYLTRSLKEKSSLWYIYTLRSKCVIFSAFPFPRPTVLNLLQFVVDIMSSLNVQCSYMQNIFHHIPKQPRKCKVYPCCQVLNVARLIFIPHPFNGF